MLIAGLIGLVFCFYLIRRNTQVAEYRRRCIDVICRRDGIDKQMYQEYLDVDYEEMFRKFWKPIDSFYAGTKLGKEVSKYA